MPSRSLGGRFFHSIFFSNLFLLFNPFAANMHHFFCFFFLPLCNRCFSTCSYRSIFSIIKSANVSINMPEMLNHLCLSFFLIVDLPFISNFSFWVACSHHTKSTNYKACLKNEFCTESWEKIKQQIWGKSKLIWNK